MFYFYGVNLDGGYTMKNWRVYYFGCLGNIVTTGRLTRRKARKIFKTLESAFSMEKVSGRFQRKIFKEDQ